MLDGTLKKGLVCLDTPEKEDWLRAVWDGLSEFVGICAEDDSKETRLYWLKKGKATLRKAPDLETGLRDLEHERGRMAWRNER